MPKYTDDEAWQETHKNKDKDEEKKRQEFLKKHPKWETFRDSCYENADKKVHFNWTHGWGAECARQDGWELETARKARGEKIF